MGQWVASVLLSMIGGIVGRAHWRAGQYRRAGILFRLHLSTQVATILLRGSLHLVIPREPIVILRKQYQNLEELLILSSCSHAWSSGQCRYLHEIYALAAYEKHDLRHSKERDD